MIRIDLEADSLRAALDAVTARAQDATPLMQDLAQVMGEQTRRRFQESRGPDGTPWAPNSVVTVMRYLGRFASSFKRDGSLSARGSARSSGKRPLIGETRTLSTAIGQAHGRDFAQVSSAAVQAAVMQFGARRGAFGSTRRGAPIPWGDIPSRPFLGLGDRDQAELAAYVRAYLSDVLEG